MSSDIIVAIIALIGTLSAAGIAAWASLRNKNHKSEERNNNKDKSNTKNNSQDSIFHGLTPASRDDISWRIGEQLAELPKEICPEEKLFSIAEQMFRRPAFYSHPERHWPGSLYAFVVTRLVWEQEFMGRVSTSKHRSADQVLFCLLEIENFVATTVGLTPDELTMLTQKYLKDKDKFLGNWRRHPKISMEDYKKRSELLERLQSSLSELGFNISGVGRNVVFNGIE